MFERVYNPKNAGLIVMEQGPGGRYSLAKFHSHDDLTTLGLSQEMIDDQVGPARRPFLLSPFA